MWTKWGGKRAERQQKNKSKENDKKKQSKNQSLKKKKNYLIRAFTYQLRLLFWNWEKMMVLLVLRAVKAEPNNMKKGQLFDLCDDPPCFMSVCRLAKLLKFPKFHQTNINTIPQAKTTCKTVTNIVPYPISFLFFWIGSIFCQISVPILFSKAKYGWRVRLREK